MKPTENRRLCKASCCNGQKEITGPFSLHEAQAVLDSMGCPVGYFGNDQELVQKFGLEVWCLCLATLTLRGWHIPAKYAPSDSRDGTSQSGGNWLKDRGEVPGLTRYDGMVLK